MRPLRLLLITGPLLLAGCDLLGIEGASAVAARREAEGQAIGAACRHAGRAIEDCYGMNKRAEKAAIKKLLNSSRFLLPVHDKPAKIEGGQVVGRLDMQVPGPITQSVPRRDWFPA